jgi:hypothetical protein
MPTTREALLTAIQNWAEAWKEKNGVSLLGSPIREALYSAIDVHEFHIVGEERKRAEAAERKLDLVQQLLQDLVDEDTLCRKEDKFLSIGAWRSAVRLVLQRIK